MYHVSKIPQSKTGVNTIWTHIQLLQSWGSLFKQ